jgi:hypothetical protein
MLHSVVTLAPGVEAGTSSCIQQCGLDHWNSLTVPVNLTVFVVSNMAPEWWADTGNAIAHTVLAAITAKVFFMMPSRPELARPAICASLSSVYRDVEMSAIALTIRIWH